MNRRDVVKGMTVYHSVFTHWGPGVVLGFVSANLGERLFERGNFRVLVQWQKHSTPSRMRLNGLRKTPNRKKIKDMVALYARRGVTAKDGGDRLILPGEGNDSTSIDEK